MIDGGEPTIFSYVSGTLETEASTKPVAPKSPAFSARSAIKSLTIICRAPKNLHQTATESPTGPPPTIKTLSPAVILALFTACKPTARGSTRAPSWNVTLSGKRKVS